MLGVLRITSRVASCLVFMRSLPTKGVAAKHITPTGAPVRTSSGRTSTRMIASKASSLGTRSDKRRRRRSSVERVAYRWKIPYEDALELCENVENPDKVSQRTFHPSPPTELPRSLHVLCSAFARARAHTHTHPPTHTHTHTHNSAPSRRLPTHSPTHPHSCQPSRRTKKTRIMKTRSA
jgi:hypothetical protein